MTTLDKVLPCPICGTDLQVKPCRPSKAGKNSLQVICPVDGRHLRGFIAHQPLVDDLLRGLRDMASPEEPERGNDDPQGSADERNL